MPRRLAAGTRRAVLALMLPLGLASCAGTWWPGGAGGDPTDPEAMFARAYWYEAQGATGEAMRDYDVVVERHPGSPLAAIARERLGALGTTGGSAAAAADPGDLAQGDAACTSPGLYPKDGRWCGIVRKRFDPYVQVEVTHLRFGTIWALGFSRSVCTGNRFLGYFSYGERVWVPRTCLVTGKV